MTKTVLNIHRLILEGETNPGGEAVVGGVAYPENGIVIDECRAVAGQLQPKSDAEVEIVPGSWVPGRMKFESTVGSLLYPTETAVLPGLYWCAQ